MLFSPGLAAHLPVQGLVPWVSWSRLVQHQFWWLGSVGRWQWSVLGQAKRAGVHVLQVLGTPGMPDFLVL